MDNQHRRISGYRELDAETIALMNRIKEQGRVLTAMVKEVQEHITAQYGRAQKAYDGEETSRLQDAEPARWAAMARSDFQVGIMKLVRAAAQPQD